MSVFGFSSAFFLEKKKTPPWLDVNLYKGPRTKSGLEAREHLSVILDVKTGITERCMMVYLYAFRLRSLS